MQLRLPSPEESPLLAELIDLPKGHRRDAEVVENALERDWLVSIYTGVSQGRYSVIEIHTGL